MKIECKANPDRRDRLLLYCDGDEWRELHTSIFGKNPSFPQTCETEEELSNYFQAVEYRQAKQYVVRRLAAQSLPSEMLRRALKLKLVSESTINRLIEEFQSLGYLNDEAWVQAYVRHLSARKLGPKAIAYKLASKGIKREDVSIALQESCCSENQGDVIGQLLTSKYRKYDLANFKERQKVIGSLMRKGFDLEDILQCLKNDGMDGPNEE